MSSPNNPFGRRVALLAALTALAGAAFATAASAKVVVTPDTGLPWEGAEVTVSGTTHPTGADDVAIVLCNATAPTGERCDPESGTPGFRSIADYTNGSIVIPVRRGPWTDFDFRFGVPPDELESTTTCYSEIEEDGDACKVVVSFYDTVGKAAVPIGVPESAPITFE